MPGCCVHWDGRPGEVGEGGCFSFALEPGCSLPCKAELVTDKACAGDLGIDRRMGQICRHTGKQNGFQ